jgi:metallophosphoesterase superfamily enzyme
MKRFEIEKSEATKYETATRDPETGKASVTELHRVFVRLKPKAGPSIIEAVEAVIAGAMSSRTNIPAHKKAPPDGVMQVLVIADPHVGKYAWSHETGWEDYDISIAVKLLRDSAYELLSDGNSRGISRRVIMLLGDYFHYDTPHGATTKGTPLDRDGRVEKMLEAGSAALFDIIEASAKSIPTEVILVPGNHDAVLTVALRQILTAHFRNDKRVVVDARGTSRKYIEHGRCLIGMTHGDKARKRLGELMAAEASEAWGRSRYREIHTGHLHSVAEVQTIGGVVIRTAPALCPPDGWHAIEGYVGAPRGMESYYYHTSGSLVGMTMSSPDSNGKAAQVKRLHKPKG